MLKSIVKNWARRPWPGKDFGAPVGAGEPAFELRREIRALPAHSCLLAQGPFQVHCAGARRIPRILTEIGRLRELTFRAVGEGAGRSIDLDRFDEYYEHLFVWNEETGEVVGAYRLGGTDVILPRFGRSGLYTNTLFRYGEGFLGRIDPGLEMGRSFVRPEYQKTFQALLLLWKGIGAYVARNPHYSILFGPVSITRDYSAASRRLIAAWFSSANHRGDLGALVRPRNPLKAGRRDQARTRREAENQEDIKQLSEAVSRLEPDGKGLPVLFKQYAKLGAAALAFNVDPDFSDVLDALMVVDLTETDKRMLEKYMGRGEASDFLCYQMRKRLAYCA